MTHTTPYLVSGLTTVTSYMAQMPPSQGSWQSIAIQAGMAGVVVLLLLKFFPMVMEHLERKDREHQQIVREIVETNRCKDDAWQKIINDRHICPKDKNGI